MKRIERGARCRVSVRLNGVPRSGWCDSRTLLCDFLRQELGATGTHVGCEHGVCGACTVHVDGTAVRACLVLAVQADGLSVDTVEGLAGAQGLNALQRAFKRHHALQCGYCTPGILMSATQFLAQV
ncbi:MAG TPA: 2Fe-2S iron-sulfur cluster-binding protein, partial [Burkholderiales bacterium]|nr:2Fe-2S iron-sulfur cluster-binding protein [Burkholderiales bacterium]